MTVPPNLSDDFVDATGSLADRVIGDRYQVLRQLKRGHETATFVASDLSNNTSVVVKTALASSFSASARMRLEHEVRALSQIGDGCPPLLAFGAENDEVYVVMPIVAGITLDRRLQQGPLPVADAIAVGRAILTALGNAHAVDVLHRDVKPANVIVDKADPLHTATLIDFGLTRIRRLDASDRHHWIKTAQYLSPEAAGMLDQEVTVCSDLYSVGIVLFECLVGRPPFEGKSVGEVLRQHMNLPPPELRSLGLSVPRVLDEVIQRLLRKDPRDRYQSAGAVDADLSVIGTAVQNGESEADLVVGLSDRRHTLTEPAFVGRDKELATLEAQLKRTEKGEGGVVLLESESGGGKSRLLTEFALRGAQQGAWIFRGQGLDQAAPRPFQLLAGVGEGLIAAASLAPGFTEEIRIGLGDRQAAVCSVFPELSAIFAADDRSQLGPESYAEARSVQALTALLDALGATGRPVLVLLDDCQWADQLTSKVLSLWQRREGNPKRSVLVVAAFRSEEVSANHPLRALHPPCHLRLPTFAPSNVRKLVESMAGPLPGEAVETIERLAEGSPFMAAAALRGLVESGALLPSRKTDASKFSRQAGGWRVEPAAMAEGQSSRHAAAFLSRRIELLPEETVELLTVGAVLGKEFDLFTASNLARQNPSQAIAALREAQRRHMVWCKKTDERCAFVHDKLRESFLARLPENERSELHRRVAVGLEDECPERVYDLAYHFDAAGESQRALPFALAAAEQARSQHALELAQEQFRIAERGVSASDEATRYRVAEGLGDVLMLRGLYPPAAEMFEAAKRLAKDDMTRAQIEGKLGELAFKQGDNKTASEALERSLRLLRRMVPSQTAAFAVFLGWELMVQTLHTLLPKIFLGRRTLTPDPQRPGRLSQAMEKELLAIGIHTHLARAYFFDRGLVPCLWTHLRSVNLAERYPPTQELGQAWATHAPVMSLVPWLRRGETFGKKSLEIRKELGDVCGQGQSLHYWGVVLFAGAKFDECIGKCDEAVRLLEGTGDLWERNMARWQSANAAYRKGELAHAIAEAQQLHEICNEMGDDKVSGFAVDLWSRASGGRLPTEVVHQAIQKDRHDVQATAQVLLAEAVRLVAQRELDEALTVLLRARAVCREVGMMNAWVSPVLPWIATVRRLQWQRSTGIPTRRRQLLKQARRAARQSLAVARKFQTDLPHALREVGLVARTSRTARRYLEESMAVAERQRARLEHAQSQLAKGRIGLDFDWPGSADEVAAARQTLRWLGADFVLDEPLASEATKIATLSLVDRFDTVLNAGRRIASALSRETILNEVREAAEQLLRGERCLLLQLHGDDGGEERKLMTRLDASYCGSVADRALSMGKVVVLNEGEVEEAGMLPAGVRSSLCAPVFVRGEPAGCFYVDHRNVSGLFGEDEKRLAEFIATIAGAALENADGFAELQRFNETLEQRVAERTAAAEEASRAKSDFLANMSHEIRTPMNGIIGMAELALQTELTDQQGEYLRIVMQSADGLLRLLNDILDLSKVEAGKLELESIAFPLGDSLGDAMHTFAMRAADKGIELAYLVPPDVPDTLIGDPGRLRQIIINLIGNSLKFTEQGEIVVVVTVDSLEEAEVGLHFMVSDTGIGISTEKQQKIFDAFSQADTSTTRRYGGSGLGLAISMQLVKLMGGKLWVESEIGEGSDFHFTVRFGITDGAPTQSWVRPEALSAMPVLVVDDNSTNRRILDDSLSNLGMQPTLAIDGPDALVHLDKAASRGEPFRLALLDVMMPDMDGFMLADRIRQDARLRDCTLIMLSSAGELENSDRCKELNIARYLIKPVKQSDLRETILQVLSRQSVSPAKAVSSVPKTGEAGSVAEERPTLRILLAEDGLTNQQVACGLLNRRGHEVVVANNGREAVEAFARESFDLVLMDVMMPEMDGFAATKAIRQEEEATGSHVRIIAMTAHALKGDRERCLKAGMDAYLSKPVQAKTLYEVIEGGGSMFG